MAISNITCSKTIWKGRPALHLANGVIEVVTLTGGGAIADLRLSAGAEELRHNVLWEAPWPSLDPNHYRPRVHNRTYGPEFVGKFLASFTGHALCLDYFGAPSESEIQQGLCLHGEASVNRWKVLKQSQSKGEVSAVMEVKLPNAGLKFQRELRIRRNETVVYVSETLFNMRATDHFFHWTQHVTLGPPFLAGGESMVFLPARRAISWPHGYEGKSLLANSKEFTWPTPQPKRKYGGHFAAVLASGTGFVAAALLDPKQDVTCIAALNFKSGLILGYCFPRKAFPWVTVWEENCARQDSPWRGATQARGLEFGTTPMPVGKREAFRTGPLFETPTFQCVPAKGKLRVTYAIFLAPANPAWREILDIQSGEKAITIVGKNHESIRVPASHAKTIGAS